MTQTDHEIDDPADNPAESQPGHQQSALPADPLWYKDAVIYQTHVKAFFDTDGDGCGDFRGLTQKLDYIRDLGVDCIWLLPFYPSPMRDDGYDISDYRNVNSAYGTRRDFRRFVSAAHRRGLRVITELIVNHTSDQHPWFQAARRAPKGSPKRNFYVWSDDDGRFPETRIIFTDTEASNWSWDPVAGQYYWHRFFSHQPDLNHNNPRVVGAMIRVMRFWLDLGVDGLRLDAIPYLCVREGTNNENLPETHAVIKRMRAVVDAHYRDRVFLAEANQWPEDVRDYFGEGDECHMAYHFPLMPRMYMALAQEDRHPIVEIMEQTPEIPSNCQWAIFLRNHDELTLEMVSDRERDYMYRTFAEDPRMRLNVGIRRRLAPLLANDPDKIRLMVSLLLSMPGSPILYYGDELGMGDNIYLGDRNGVRTPMQWSPDRNAGFSRADPEQLYLPPIMDPIYGYQSVNVEAQSRSPASLLNWMRRVIAARKAHQVFGRGDMELLHPGNRKILAYVRRHRGGPDGSGTGQGTGEEAASGPAPAEDDDVVLCVANLARGAQPVELNLSAFAGRVPIELLGQTPFPPIGELPYLLTLPGHGFYWFQLSRRADAPSWHDERVVAPRLATLVLPEGWTSLLPERAERRRTAVRARAELEERVLPAYLGQRRSRLGPCGEPLRVRVEAIEPWQDWLLTLVHLEQDAGGGDGELLLLPLSLTWPDLAAGLDSAPPEATTLAQVRRHATTGLLREALADAGFVRSLVCAIGDGDAIPVGAGRLRLQPTRAFAELAGDCDGAPAYPLLEDSDNAAVLAGRLLLKTLRCRVSAAGGDGGVDPVVELGRYLTEEAGFTGVPALAGHIDYEMQGESACPVALLERFVPNQGSLWVRTRELLQRLVDEQAHVGGRERGDGADRAQYDLARLDFEALIDRLGRRVGELHRALAAGGAGPASDLRPEPVPGDAPDRWRADAVAAAERALEWLRGASDDLPDAARGAAERLLARADDLAAAFSDWSGGGLGPARQRIHGDLHLQRVLVAEDDVVLVNAGGPAHMEPAPRRRKRFPEEDLGRLVASLHAAVLDVQQATRDEHPAADQRLSEWLTDWCWSTVERLVHAYAAAVTGLAAAPRPDEPGPDGRIRRLTRLFALRDAVDALDASIPCSPERRAQAIALVLRLLPAAEGAPPTRE